MMRDRLINHALFDRACEDKLGADQQPAFCFIWRSTRTKVDVNVHLPSTRRFHQSRRA